MRSICRNVDLSLCLDIVFAITVNYTQQTLTNMIHTNIGASQVHYNFYGFARVMIEVMLRDRINETKWIIVVVLIIDSF